MEYRVLGPVEVLDDDGAPVDVGPRQQRALLALLLVNVGRVVSTERILDELWADDPEGKEKTLWVYISRLRSALEPARAAHSKGTVLVTRDHGYALTIDPDDVDAHCFGVLVEKGRALVRDNPTVAAELLTNALAMWRGEPYEDFTYDDFAQGEITNLRETQLSATEDRVDAEIRTGRQREVIGELDGLMRANPLRERPVELLMIALYRSGRQADALRTYQSHRRTVGEELGIEPSPELRRIEEQVLLHDPRLNPSGELASLELAQQTHNPFKGLQAFTEEDVAAFFGRDRLISEIVRRLAAGNRLVALVGASGSGKSSALRAGLIPTMRKGAVGDPDDWLVAQMVPGSRPFTELEAALLRSTLDAPESLAELLDHSEDGLLRAGLRLLPERSGRLLLVIDQFEELFTLVESEPERVQFIRNLEVALTDPHNRIVVALALRADFYDRPLAYGSLAALLGDSIINVVPLTPDELEEAAEGPAELAGVQFEPALLTRLLSDVAGQSGGLPLFQYALTELFDRRAGALLTAQAYQEMQGVGGAITRRAEEIYLGLAPSEQTACKQLFLRLVTIAEAGAWSRRRVAASEIVTIVEDVVDLQSVLDKFATFRLLTFDRDYASGSPTVEVAHEALLHEWPRLTEWIEEGRDDVIRHARFLTALGEWHAAEEKADYLLSGQRLSDYEKWANSSTMHLTSREQHFLDDAIAQREEQLAAEAERTARESKRDRQAKSRLRGLAAAGALLALVAIALLIAAFVGKPPRIVAVHGATGDFGINDLMVAGVASAADQFEVDIEQRQPLIDPVADLRELADTGADLIMVSSDFDQAVQLVAAEYPDVRFVGLDPVLIKSPAANITEMHFAVEDSAFLAGVTAALASQSATVGFIGGFQTLATERSRVGFERGATFEDAAVKVDSRYLGPMDVPWVKGNESPDLAYELAVEMYASGVDVIYHDAGNSSAGILQAAREMSEGDRHLWVIGSEVDQALTTPSAEDSAHVLASAIKRYDSAVVNAVDAFLAGELPAGDVELGLVESGVGLTHTGGHLDELGILGQVLIVEGEMLIDHIPPEPYAEVGPGWQYDADVTIHMVMGSDFCRVTKVDGAEAIDGRIRIPRGDRVIVRMDNQTDQVAGIGFRTIALETGLDQLAREAAAGIPPSLDGVLALSLIAPQASTTVSALMDGTPFVPNCFFFEPTHFPADFLPVIVSPAS